MKKLILLIFLLMFVQIGYAQRFYGNKPTAPLTCNSLVGSLYYDYTEKVFKWCSDTDIWTALGSGSGGTGILSLNGLTADPQTFAIGTSGTNFNIVSSVSTHTFNFPDASGTNRGLLTSANWTTFNNKVSLTGAETLTNKTLTSPVINVGGDATGDVYFRNGSGEFTRLGIADDGDVLTLDGGLPTWIAPTGGSGSPGGSDTQVQFNNAGAFGGSANFTYTSSTSQLKLISANATDIPLVVRGHASQSGNFFEMRNSSEAVLARMTSAGKLFLTAGGYSAGAYSIMPQGETQIGIDFLGATNIGFFITNVRQLNIASGVLNIGSSSVFSWNSQSANNGANDSGLGRQSAGVVKCTDGGATNIRCLQGGGTAVASATALPLPTGRVFHVTGTTTVTSITSTNFQSGVCITLIFDGILTFTDGSNLKLAGDFVTTADDTISLCYDGTSWFETGRSIN